MSLPDTFLAHYPLANQDLKGRVHSGHPEMMGRSPHPNTRSSAFWETWIHHLHGIPRRPSKATSRAWYPDF